MTNIKAMLVIIRTWRSHFDEKWPMVEKLPHPLGRLNTKSRGGHIWLD
jgi:hypothetical protein